MNIPIISRPRRNRKSIAIRNMIQENRISIHQLVQPYFLVDGKNKKIDIASMPNIYRYSIDNILKDIESLHKKGLQSIILFPAVEDSLKDTKATYSYAKDNFYLQAITTLKKEFPEIAIITDVAMDPYSSDGHDGYVKNGKIDNDITLPILAKMALAQAEAGADIIGPSDMMDGRVGVIREALDAQQFSEVTIMSYTAKYASAFYGPFRDALDSAPKYGDKLTYQMHPANARQALIEAELDTLEGADFLMVKPALAYLDIIQKIKENTNLPVVAYNVSGEYAMVKAAAEKGWLDERKIRDEILMSIKRAGADIIISYFTNEYILDYSTT